MDRSTIDQGTEDRSRWRSRGKSVSIRWKVDENVNGRGGGGPSRSRAPARDSSVVSVRLSSSRLTYLIRRRGPRPWTLGAEARVKRQGDGEEGWNTSAEYLTTFGG